MQLLHLLKVEGMDLGLNFKKRKVEYKASTSSLETIIIDYESNLLEEAVEVLVEEIGVHSHDCFSILPSIEFAGYSKLSKWTGSQSPSKKWRQGWLPEKS